MRLIRCYIENFGTLHQQELTFTEGLNTILRENGWGKSTCMTFLLVMFYGFGNERKRSLLENERKRFAPWQQGRYGGSVTFSYAGKHYRIEREFGYRDGKDDRCVVYDDRTKLPVSELGEVPGETVFGIDRESFVRSVFLAEQDCETVATAGISAKIGNLSEELFDLGAYDATQKRLKQELDRLTPNRKTGEIRRCEDRIAELELIAADRTGAEEAALALRRSWKEKRELQKQLEVLEQETQQELERAGAQKEEVAQLVTYRALVDAERSAKQKLAELEAQFPMGIPLQEDVEQLLTACDRYQQLDSMRGPQRNQLKLLEELLQEREPEEEEPETHASNPGVRLLVGLACLLVGGILWFGFSELLYGICLGILGLGILAWTILSKGKQHHREADRSHTRGKSRARESYAHYEEEYRRTRKALQQTESELAALRESLERFFETFGWEVVSPRKQLRKLRDTLHRLELQTEIYRTRKAARLAYEQEHPTEQLYPNVANGEAVSRKARSDDPDAKTSSSLPELGAKLRALRVQMKTNAEDIHALERQMEQSDARLEQIAEAELTAAQMQEQRKTLRHQYEILSKTRTYLEAAKQQFSARYMTPLKRSFDRYYTMLAGDAKEYEIDANLHLVLREQGMSRDLAMLSSGYRDLVGLCFRLAMTDAMYPGEKPFLILDDPFVNLDDDKIEKAMDFLEQVAETYQIIYFTCQSARCV